jgi:hypothetical protein
MRRALPLLLAGWLLGVVTAFAVAYAVLNLLYERRTYWDRDPALQATLRSGWIVIRTNDQWTTIERPRLHLP